MRPAWLRLGPWWLRLACAGAAALILAIAAAPMAVEPPSLERARRLSPEILDGSGELLRAFTTEHGTWRLGVRVQDVSPLYLDLLVAYEDRRFAAHPGVDPVALARAFYQWVRDGRVVSGASTITMQTARLLEPGERSFGYKLRQIARALALERRYSKDEILQTYLTLAPFGGNLEGIRAASLAYFGKEPQRMSLAEAALLVAIPQAPGRRPDRAPEAARAARNRVLQRMVAFGRISPEAAATASREPVPERRRALPALAPHLSQSLLAQARREGHVRTTIDGVLQARLERVVKRQRDRIDPSANVAILVVRNSDAAIVAHIGSLGPFDSARSGALDFTHAVRSPGSALKPFIYGMAFETLTVHPDTLILDAPVRYGNYTPTNFEGEYGGLTSVRDALLHSLNTTAVALIDALGPARFVARLRASGADLRLSVPDGQAGPVVAVGGCGIALEDLVALYTAFSNHGRVRPLRRRADEPVARGTVLLSPDAAWAVADILAEARRPGAPPTEQVDGRRHVAYKTGTSAAYRDAWAIGFDADHTVGVWVGRADAAPMPGQYGRLTSAPLLFRVFDLMPRPLADPAGLPPAGTPLVPRTDLPPRLSRFPPSATEADRLVIDTPADGAQIAAPAGGIVLRGRGGHAPYRWFADGQAVGEPSDTIEAVWQPNGRGNARLELFDGAGQWAAATIWVELLQ